MLLSTFLLCLQFTIKTVGVVLYVAGQNNMHLYLVLIVIAIETKTIVFTASMLDAKKQEIFFLLQNVDTYNCCAFNHVKQFNSVINLVPEVVAIPEMFR